MSAARLGKLDALAADFGARILEMLDDYQDEIEDLAHDRFPAEFDFDTGEDEWFAMVDQLEEKVTLRACHAIVARKNQTGDKVAARIDEILRGE